MAPSNSEREARESKQRLRNYQARQTVHASQVTRRRRDNLVSVIVVIVVVIVAIVVQVFYFSGGPGAPVPSPSSSATPEPTASPSASPSSTENTGDVPPTSVAEGRDWTGTMTINEIPLALSLDGVAAPQAVSSFISLVQAGFYTGLTCHRLTTTGIFVLQCGDPNGDGSGGPGYSYGPVENAPADNVYPAGTLAMARQGNNGYSNGSQFFIVYADSTIPSDTAGGYTVLGRITGGLDQLQSGVIAAGVTGGTETPAVPTTITDVTVQ
ncbi:peptidylprolyl isomerase [Subtercola boreus]|uniref:peptidylprolyl isomerase n=1 Tax=Subtercola boreus TaxID=120213 RepID=A0A3E0VJ62_9MICO|nr:peptidylprolyl isomerase [Subtercola boreus]RFA09420.1 peptidylprolyl isomerase [Subtercola boreus]TQL53537.1 peptidyl-prolyl cis-trans isomerase B (cyclophilin B) [Subtercola boreus]